MKTWQLGALIVVGLIVAGIAYTMYEEKKKRVGVVVGDVGAVLENRQTQRPAGSDIPGKAVTGGGGEPQTNFGPPPEYGYGGFGFF
jgi:hypothetical protein